MPLPDVIDNVDQEISGVSLTFMHRNMSLYFIVVKIPAFPGDSNISLFSPAAL